MKHANSLMFLALALLCAAPLASRAYSGDIVDIRVVGTDEMTFGDRNSLSPKRCTADNPLVTGNDLYVRVRMLVRNWEMASHGAEQPQVWTFQPGALGQSSLYLPKLGLWIGGRPAYATYSDYGYYAWQKSGTLTTDDAGNVDPEWTYPPWQYYTDFYFAYKVQAGDLGLPVMLMNSAGTGPASSVDTNTGYYLLNCSEDGSNHNWLKNANGDVARFWYGPETLDPDWPDGVSGDTPLRNYDLSAEGAYVKTIDFDKINAAGDPYSEGDIWRDVYPGMSAAPGTVPTLIIGGGASAAATTVYIWSGDESVVVPVASGANTVSTVDIGGETRQVLKVVVPAGVESVAFSMKGAAAATVGATAKIYMSPAQGAVYKPTGELGDITVSRWVGVATAPEPTVTISLGGQTTDAVTADADYMTAKKQLVIKMTPACDQSVTVRLNASVSGDDTLASLQNIYDANIIRIADGDYGGDPLDQKTIDVEIPATRTAVYKNVYILGGTTKTGSKGITFSTTKISGPDNATTSGSCTLKINRSTPTIVDSDPAFSTDSSPSTITVVSGTSQTFSLNLADAYRDLNDTNTGYTFKWACDTEEIADETGVTMNDDGLFEASAEFSAITDGTELTLCVVNPDGKTSAKVKYDLVVTDAKKTTVAFQDPLNYVFPESDTIMGNILLGLSQPYSSGVSYIFLESNDPESFACVDSSLKTSGAQVDRGRTTTVMPFYQMRFLDGAANVTVKAVLYKNSDHSNRLTAYTAGTLSFTITNVPPQVMSVTAAGQYLTPDMNGRTIDPVSRGIEESFTLVAGDVAADLSSVTVKWVIDGTQYEKGMDPSNIGQTLAVKHTFANVKEKAQVRVYLKDKDMVAYPSTPNFMFYVPVSEKSPPSISNVVAQQRLPWNGLVDVDYEVGGNTDGLAVRISFAEVGHAWVATNFLAGAEPSAAPGAHRATWDTTAAGVTNVAAAEVIATVEFVRE